MHIVFLLKKKKKKKKKKKIDILILGIFLYHVLAAG